MVPDFSAYNAGYYSSGVPVGYSAWRVNDQRTFTFHIPEQKLVPGTKNIRFIAVDSNGYSGITTVSFQVSSSNPQIQVPTSSNEMLKIGIFQYDAIINVAPQSTAQIRYVGIDDPGAIPQFSGVLYRGDGKTIPSTSRVWSANAGGTFSWTIDPRKWNGGPKTITVYAVDTLGRVSTGSTTYYVPALASWTLTQREPAILGKSVLISLDMSVDSSWKKTPPVAMEVQTGPTKTGPWNTVGKLTLDDSGKTSVRVLMEKSVVWVRASHPEQDSVQVGFSTPVQLLSVADQSARGMIEQSGARLMNEDGTYPEVSCKVNAKNIKSVVCNATNVQDPNQPISLQVLKGKIWTTVSTVSYQDVMKLNFKSVSSSTLTYRLRGEGSDSDNNPYTPWVSASFKSRGR